MGSSQPEVNRTCNENHSPKIWKIIWLILISGVFTSCSTPEPTDLELTYAKKMKESEGMYYEIRQTPQAELSPDDEIAMLRDSYTTEAISDIADYTLENYDDDLEGALLYLKKQRFECTGRTFIKCENYTKVGPLTLDPLAFLRSEPTHCVSWRIDITAQDNAIRTLSPSSFVSDCGE